VTHLLYAEEGPWDVVARARLALRRRFAARALDCFYCLSLWVAVPFALLTTMLNGGGWLEQLLVWPALSAGSILLERLTVGRSENVEYREDPKEP
jgi:hypothetical protein